MNGIENGLSKSAENGNKLDDDDGSDLDDLSDDDDYDEYDKTLLENYNSCIDANDEVDEFVIFKDTLQCKHLLCFSNECISKNCVFLFCL